MTQSQAKQRPEPLQRALQTTVAPGRRTTKQNAKRRALSIELGVAEPTTYCTSTLASLSLSFLFATAIVQMRAVDSERAHRPAGTCIRHKPQTCVRVDGFGWGTNHLWLLPHSTVENTIRKLIWGPRCIRGRTQMGAAHDEYYAHAQME